MFMIIREPSAAGGGAAAMSAPQERTPKQVRVSMWLCVCVCTLKLGFVNKKMLQCGCKCLHIFTIKKKDLPAFIICFVKCKIHLIKYLNVKI